MGFGKELFFYGTGFGFGALGYSLMKEGDDLSVIGAGLLGLGIISVIYGSAYGIAYRKANESKEKTSQLEEKTSQLEKKLREEMKIIEKRANMTDAEKFAEKKICVLSQYGGKTLETNDKNKFEYFVFGGILGDKPAKRRTEDIIKELNQNKIKFEERNLGSAQMPTDNAVYASKKILGGAKLNELKFIDEVEVQINDNESVSLPFRYVVDNNNLIISEKLVKHLRKRKEF